MNIGIAALDSSPGHQGGLDVYLQQLVEALAKYETHHRYVILVDESCLETWQYRDWPSHVRFFSLVGCEPIQSLPVRLMRRSLRLLGGVVPPVKGEGYIARQIDALHLDLIHYPATTIKPLVLQTPCVLGFSDMQHEYYPQFFTEGQLQLRAKTHRASVQKAEHIIAPSAYTRDTLIDKYAVAADMITVIPHGIFPAESSFGAVDIVKIRTKYRLPETFIYYPANPWQHKNHARLIAALRIYAQRYGEPPHLVVSGRLNNELRSVEVMAIAAGLEDFVTDVGFIQREDMSALFKAATMMVFPSIFEGFGIPLVEAMAAGCPIAAANATAIPECVGPAALLFNPFDAGVMAEAIHRMMTDEALRKDLVKRGYEQVARYAWKGIIPRIVAVYESVLQEG